MENTVPAQVSALIWTKAGSHIDLEKDATVIIHHVLRFGTLTDIAWLLKTYPHTQIRQVFLSEPLTIYSRPALHFVKNNVLNLVKDSLNEHRYLQSFS